MESEEKPLILWQSNVLTSARYEMTKLEKNILYMVMAQIKRDDPIDQLYYVSTLELMKKTGEEIQYERMKAITEKLITRILQADLPNGDYLQTAFIASAQYLKGTGTIEIEISQKIRPFYLNLKQKFTTFELDVAISLNSIYAKRLYEVLSMHKNLDNKTFKINLNDLKAQLAITDAKSGKDKYPLYADFKRNVLKPSEEINEKSDISFSVKEIKAGRKVVQLEFIVSPNPSSILIDYNDQETALFGRLINQFKLRKDQAVTVLKQLSIADLNKHLYDIQLRVKNNEIRNIGSYTAEVLGVK